MGADLDFAALHAWLEPQMEDLQKDPADLSAHRIKGGQSNPSWILSSGESQWVLRTKPAPVAQLPRSAHAIEREYAVQAALRDTDVPVARMRALCEDESVIGVMFYVMDFVPGRIFREGWAPGVEPSERTAIYEELARVIAKLHAVDIDAVGLAGYGRRGAYFERLFSRWSRMYEATKTHEIPAMDRLIEWLPNNVPEEAGDEITLVHGDFRLENLIVDDESTDVRAVLDWELSTLGHPLVDVAYTTLPWHLRSGAVRGFGDMEIEQLGIPTQEQFVRRYCELAGRADADQVLADWPFYLGCNFLRLAGILQGIAKRVQEGIAAGPNAAETGAMAGPVAETGWRIISENYVV